MIFQYRFVLTVKREVILLVIAEIVISRNIEILIIKILHHVPDMITMNIMPITVILLVKIRSHRHNNQHLLVKIIVDLAMMMLVIHYNHNHNNNNNHKSLKIITREMPRITKTTTILLACHSRQIGDVLNVDLLIIPFTDVPVTKTHHKRHHY